MNKIIIIDSSSLMHRAYYAIPHLTTKTGEPVNATYGFFSLLIKAIEDFNPCYVVATFDLPVPTFRHDKFKEYKATRAPTPDNLVLQIPQIKEGVRKMGVPILEKEGFEADDIIGTVCHISQQAKDIDLAIAITGDMDILQLVGRKTNVYLSKRGIKDAELCDTDKVKAIYGGLEPKQLIDYKALRGDASDNIPGVMGIGEKTAIKLILEFNSLDNLYAEIKKETEKAQKISKSIRQKLINHKQEAFLSKELVTIINNVPIDDNIENYLWKGYNNEIKDFLHKMEFNTLLNRTDNGKNLSLFD